jgi:hypothetical protein
MMSKTFNQLTTKDPVCIRITTKVPILYEFQRIEVKNLFQNVICENKASVIDVAYETVSLVTQDTQGIYQLNEKQNIYVCFDKWIAREPTSNIDSPQNISFSGYMNEMSEIFANSGIIYGNTFLCDIPDMTLDMDDWRICYYDSMLFYSSS